MRLGGRIRSTAVVLAVVAWGAACGGPGRAGDAGTREAAGGTGGTTTTAGGGSGKPGAAKAAPGGKGEAAGGGPTTTAVPATYPTVPPEDPMALPTGPGPKGQLEIEVSLAGSCVRPGGTQSITITTRPQAGVGFDTVYADGRGGAMEGHHGGNLGGQTDDKGTWAHTWVVAPTAPAGQARVNVVAAHIDWGTTQKSLFFDVAGAGGTCG